jgi:formylmethanofuran dehydrogenase subunit E
VEISTLPDDLQRAIAFHGHFCGGLSIGYRAATIALQELGVGRAQDEELVAVCEHNSCGVDAMQVLTGCTLGKGNLILRDWGKQVYTVGRRSDGRMLRLSLRARSGAARGGSPAQRDGGEPEALSAEERLARLLSAPAAEIFDMRWVEQRLPTPAGLFHSVRCAQCGENVMEPRAHLRDGQPVCPECYGEPYSRGW